MASCPIDGKSIDSDKLVSNEILSNLYEGMVTEGGGKAPIKSAFKGFKSSTHGKVKPGRFQSTTKEDFTLEEAINQMNSQIDTLRRSRRLQGKPPSDPTDMELEGGGEDEDKKKAIENTQMMTFGIIATIIIGAYSTDLAKVLLNFTKQTTMGFKDYMLQYGGNAWEAVQPQIQNFGDAYWKQVGSQSLCHTNMDFALDRAMKYPLVSGYIGGDGFWDWSYFVARVMVDRHSRGACF